MSWIQFGEPLLLGLGTWVIALATVGLALGTICGVRSQSKALGQALRTDAFSRFSAQWDGREMRGRRRQVARWLLSVDRNAEATAGDARISEVVDFFEDIGAMLRKDRVDFDLTWQAFSEDAAGWWLAIGKKFALTYRLEATDPASYSEYEYLAQRIEREDRRRVPDYQGWTEDDIVGFLESERDLLPDEPIRVVFLTGK